MLAPRKTLWSTPLSAVDHLQRWIQLRANDCVCDIGCGDGRILFQWAERHAEQHPDVPVRFIGIDIDPERIEKCHSTLQTKTFPATIQLSFVCANALESTSLFQDATIFFLYLIPRGLKIILPVLKEHQQAKSPDRCLQVATYMAKLPGETPVDRALLSVDHQPEAAWPLYFYKLS